MFLFLYIVSRLAPFVFCVFFFNDTATTEIYTLSLHDALPICRTGLGERVVALRIPVEQLLHAVPQLVRLDERPVGVGREGEAVGNLDAVLVQGADHLTERGVLAADPGKIGRGEVGEPANEL